MAKIYTSYHDLPIVMTAEEVSEAIGSNPRFVINEIQRNNLIGKKIGKGWSVTKYHLGLYLNLPVEKPGLVYDVVREASDRTLRRVMNVIPQGELNEAWLAHITVNEVMRQLTLYEKGEHEALYKRSETPFRKDEKDENTQVVYAPCQHMLVCSNYC